MNVYVWPRNYAKVWEVHIWKQLQQLHPQLWFHSSPIWWSVVQWLVTLANYDVSGCLNSVGQYIQNLESGLDCGLDFGLNNGHAIWTIIFTRGQKSHHIIQQQSFDVTWCCDLICMRRDNEIIQTPLWVRDWYQSIIFEAIP